MLELATELGFPLASFACTHGAGLAVRGDESCTKRGVAQTVIIEMGYNDDSSLSAYEATKRMRKKD